MASFAIGEEHGAASNGATERFSKYGGRDNAHPRDERLQQEAREARDGGGAPVHALQFRAYPPDAEDHARDGRKSDRRCVGHRGNRWSPGDGREETRRISDSEPYSERSDTWTGPRWV